MKKLLDIFGKEVEVGDIIILAVHSALEFHQVLKINDKTMKVSCLRECNTHKWGKGTEVWSSLWTSRKLGQVSEHNSFVYKQRYDNIGILKLDNPKDLVNPDNIKSTKQLIKEYKEKHNIT